MSEAAANPEAGIRPDIALRRTLLATHENPMRRSDYMVRFEGTIEAIGFGKVTIEIAYVPDRVVIGRAAFSAYLKALECGRWTAIEAVGADILADLESELVPRYVRVTLHAGRNGEDTVAAYVAAFESRQPDWKNDGLLARLA